MNPYPVTIKDRAAKRQEILDRLLTEARDRAEQTGRSLNCNERGQLHGPGHTPCLGGPERCLCECHDPVLVSAGEMAKA